MVINLTCETIQLMQMFLDEIRSPLALMRIWGISLYPLHF